MRQHAIIFKKTAMKPFATFIFFSAMAILLGAAAEAQTLQELNKKRVMLPNGWSITPVGQQVGLGDLPLNLVVSNNKKMMAVTNNGVGTHSIELIEAASGKKLDSMVIGKAWYGLAFGDDDQSLYVSAGHDNQVNRYSIIGNKLALKDEYILGKPWPALIGTAGLDVDEKGSKQLFVVSKEGKSLFVFDLASKKLLNKLVLGAEAYACKLSKDRNTLYISLWGDKKVLVYDVPSQTITDSIPVGDHPNELLLTKNGGLLYVANSQDNSISVIDTKTRKVVPKKGKIRVRQKQMCSFLEINLILKPF